MYGKSKGGSKGKDMWDGVVKQKTPCCPMPKNNSGLKNDSYIRPQSK